MIINHSFGAFCSICGSSIPYSNRRSNSLDKSDKDKLFWSGRGSCCKQIARNLIINRIRLELRFGFSKDGVDLLYHRLTCCTFKRISHVSHINSCLNGKHKKKNGNECGSSYSRWKHSRYL